MSIDWEKEIDKWEKSIPRIKELEDKNGGDVPVMLNSGVYIEYIKEMQRLIQRDKILYYLQMWGVDNWSGFSEAMRDFYAEIGN